MQTGKEGEEADEDAHDGEDGDGLVRALGKGGGVIYLTVNLFLRYDDEQCSQWRLGECSIS